MDELEFIDILEAHLQGITEKYGLSRIWGEKPGTYIVHGFNLQESFHQVIQRVWFQKLNGEVNLYTLEGQIVFQLEDVINVLAHVILYRTHVAQQPRGIQSHRKCDPPPRDYEFINRQYSTHLDSVFEKLYTFWNHQATLLNYYLPKGLPTRSVNYIHVLEKIPDEFLHLEAAQWLLDFKQTKYKDFNELRKHVVHYGPFQARNQMSMVYSHDQQAKREELLEYLNAPIMLREMVFLARESYYHLLHLLEAMDAVYYPKPA
ncbi:Cthe_2314 family HEPN domain-containing protein [Hymenobacter wooponensis]|uniref:Cthe-2314-like HEPN domain-containing protein n=1 Tax=Hymenobacter wooponensis TaxID=1525360 RepID=A0A4Z0MMK4_9BACT|nr:Cthe_2314 family HEPN domain-containing protein [Hymenobacter wooponensis]TGD80821.1 hypothetical protein EU557_13540 [Hymenobacter wooponensis]